MKNGSDNLHINELLNKNIIIFGSSKAGEELYRILSDIDLSVKYFVDNDENKWGKTLFDKTIRAPSDLYGVDKDKDFIVIGSMYINEISKQLDEMNLSSFYTDMYSLVDILTIKNLANCKFDFIKTNNNINYGKNKYLLILPRGFVTGGAELWVLKSYNLLLNRGREATLVRLSDEARENYISSPEENYRIVDLINKEKSFFSYIEYLINNISKLSPCTLITTNTYEIYLACQFFKKTLKHNIKLISVLHSDVDFVYIQNKRYASAIDKFICVSDDIRQKLTKTIYNREKDIHTLIAPIKTEEYIRDYSPENEPIKLGYVGRLVKSYKRADHIIKLIEMLEKKGINYQFSIAGVGEYSQIINEYIMNKNLSDKVKFLGGIPNNLIDKFWREQDIFINVSDVEGACISMYEGMYNGAIPIVTNVAGAKKFVEHGENGFIVDIGDIDSMAEYIKYLYENRNLLEVFGKKSSQRVFYLCNPDNFINDLIEICEAD